MHNLRNLPQLMSPPAALAEVVDVDSGMIARTKRNGRKGIFLQALAGVAYNARYIPLV
jgi:hypothetical protein